jgi:succinate dehydrogenase / fumarate reductase membrane anchor subunit
MKQSGLNGWLLQRLTALFLVFWTLVVLDKFIFAAPESFAAWQAWVGAPMCTTGFLIAIIAILSHAWIGLHEVFIDYLHDWRVRLTALSLFGLLLIGCGLWLARAVLSASLAG